MNDDTDTGPITTYKFKQFSYVQPMGGVQEKVGKSAIYHHEDDENLLYFIKSSKVGDDISEVMCSHFLRDVFPEQIAECSYLYDPDTKPTILTKPDKLTDIEWAAISDRLNKDNDKTVYVVSKGLEGYNPLFEHKLMKNFMPLSPARRDTYIDIERSGLKQDMANLVCGNLWQLNPDCHTENIGKIRGKTKLGGIDFGWGLINICKEKNYVVKPFESLIPFGYKKGDHEAKGIMPIGLPTNHFKNFPEVIYSEEMIKSIDELTSHYNTKKSIEKIISTELDKALEVYGAKNMDKRDILKEFGMHIGINKDNDPNFFSFYRRKSTGSKLMRAYIESKLCEALRYRRNSLLVMKTLINAKLHADKKYENKKTREELLQDVQNAFNNFRQGENEAYNHNAILEEHIPPFGKTILRDLTEGKTPGIKTTSDSDKNLFTDEHIDEIEKKLRHYAALYDSDFVFKRNHQCCTLNWDPKKSPEQNNWLCQSNNINISPSGIYLREYCPETIRILIKVTIEVNLVAIKSGKYKVVPDPVTGDNANDTQAIINEEMLKYNLSPSDDLEVGIGTPT